MSTIFDRKSKPRKRCRIILSEDENGAIGGVCARFGILRYMFGRHHGNTIEKVVKTFRQQWRQDNARQRNIWKDTKIEYTPDLSILAKSPEEYRKFLQK